MCDSCDTLREVARTAEMAASELASQVEALQKELTFLAQRNGRLKTQIERQNGEGAEAKLVIEIIEYWVTKTGHTKAKVSASGERADYVRKALRLGHSKEELFEAIDGAARFPFVDKKRGRPPSMRTHMGTEEQRYDDLKTIFKSEITIGRMRDLARLPALKVENGRTEIVHREFKTPIDRVLAALMEARATWEVPEPDVWLTDCPACYSHRKLRVKQNAEGMVSIECLRGCDWWRPLRALGLQIDDLINGGRPESRPETPEHLKEAARVLQSKLAGMS